MQFITGSLVVFEGLDATGKSTQTKAIEEFANKHCNKPIPLFTHQPTGSSPTGKAIYKLTENERYKDMHPVTRQLLHLASHAEHYDVQILPALHEQSVFMDRNWWSTVAYGYFSGGINKLYPYDDFLKLARLPARGYSPDLVFLFNKPYAPDSHNTPALEQGYSHLATSFPEGLVVVPAGDPQWVTKWILDRLVERNIIMLDTKEAELWNATRTKPEDQWGRS